MPRDDYNTGSNSEHRNWLNKCVANFNWPIINIFVFQNRTIEILDKNQKMAGEFSYWYLKKVVEGHKQMEKYTVFMDWKNQYCQNGYTTQSNL